MNSKGYGVFIEGNGIATNAETTPITTLEEFENAGNTFTNNALGEVN